MFCGLPPALASEHTSPSDSPLPHFLLQGGGAPLPGTRPLDPTIDGAGHTITIAPRCSIAEATAVDLAHPAAQAKGAGFCILFCWVSDAHPKLTETAATSLFLRILFMKKCSFSMSPPPTQRCLLNIASLVSWVIIIILFFVDTLWDNIRGLRSDRGPSRCSRWNLACPIIVQGGVCCVLTNCSAGAGAV